MTMPWQIDGGEVAKRLTRREKEIILCMALGKTNQNIAGELGLSETTIKTHTRNILRKLGAANKAHAVAISLWSEFVFYKQISAALAP